MNVQIAYNLFLVDHEAYCSEQSIVYYRFNVQKFVDFLSDRIGLASDLIECDVISRELVLAYLSQLRGTGCKNTSINTYFRAAKVFLNYCIDEGYCSADVLRKVKFLKKTMLRCFLLRNGKLMRLMVVSVKRQKAACVISALYI